jgi:hypothetical protein
LFVISTIIIQEVDMKHPAFLLLPVGLILALIWLSSMSAPAQGTVIDFETPPLAGAPNQQIDPYIDAGTGISFTVPGRAGVIGLVQNSATSACVLPADSNQKLATGTDKSTIGAASFAIQATFATLLQPPVRVAVAFQTGVDVPLRVRLFGPDGKEVATVLDNSGASGSNCSQPGGDRARKQVVATSAQPVAYAIMDLDTATGSRVFVLDDFAVESGAPTVLAVPRDNEALVDIDNFCGEKEYLRAATSSISASRGPWVS